MVHVVHVYLVVIPVPFGMHTMIPFRVWYLVYVYVRTYRYVHMVVLVHVYVRT
jgi:hypothetical protein